MPGRYRFPRPSRRFRLTRLEPRERQQKLESHDLPVNRRPVITGSVQAAACWGLRSRQAITVTAGQVSALNQTITVSNEGGSTASETAGRNDSGKRRRRARRLRQPASGDEHVLGLRAAPMGTLAGSERFGPGPSGKAFHVAGLPDPQSSSAVLPMPASPRSTSIPLSSSRAAVSAHSSASGPGLDGRPMAFV